MSKHKPATRAEFKQMILRRLGAPVITINVSDEQVEDCIEEALKYFQDYHYDGTEHVYYVHTCSPTDISNKYITVPDNIIGITEVYSLNIQSYTAYSADMFGGGYQMAFEFAWSTSSGTLLTYYMNKVAYEFLNQILIGQTPIRFNRHTNRLYIDFNWTRVESGMHIVLDGYKIIDPEENPEIWNDRWLINYATAKVKYIYGTNLSKFTGVQLPGGGTIDGQKIQDDAMQQLQSLEDEMITSYSIPPRDVIA